ncbi:hypothetical protein V2J09_013398 [Rumex salicifolius]
MRSNVESSSSSPLVAPVRPRSDSSSSPFRTQFVQLIPHLPFVPFTLLLHCPARWLENSRMSSYLLVGKD